MENWLYMYLFISIVYFMYRAGELARERGYIPFRWQFFAYLTTISTGSLLGFLVALLNSTSQNIPLLFIAFTLGSIVAGFFLLSRLKKRPVPPSPKRTYRAYNLKNAFLFPRVIPRGGFLWRSVAYTILFTLIPQLIILPFRLGKESLTELPWAVLVPGFCLFIFGVVGIHCLGLLYYISHICIPRIRDAGLSRDTLIMLFLPIFNFVAFFQLLLTPTRMSGRSSI